VRYIQRTNDDILGAKQPSFMKYLFLSLTLLSLLACQQTPKSPETLRPQVESFADKIQNGLAEGKVGVLDMHFDKGVFVDRVVDDRYWDEQLKLLKAEDYKQNYRQQLLRELSLAGLFLSGIDGRKFFAYDLAKIYRIQDRWHAVFRMYANDALNYHDMLLRVDSNKVWIEDVYIMAVGRQLSDIMHESYVAGIPSAQSNQRKRDNLLLMRSKFLLDNERYNESLATFDSISSDYKKQKALRLYRLQIGANIPDQAYVRELERFEKDFPDDAGTLLLQIDKNFLYGNYPDVLKSIEKLEAVYGRDPVVDYLHANALNGLGKCQDAFPLYEHVLTQKPGWQEPFFNWVSCALKERDFSTAIAVIQRYENAYDLTPIYVKYMFSDYPNFFLSKDFKDWEAANS
jgi:hypothetical protein